MPDRMSNGEIEDVISSIRKLVSGDEASNQTDAEEERLVLTSKDLIDDVLPKDPPLAEEGPLKLGEAIAEDTDDALKAELAELEAQVFEEDPEPAHVEDSPEPENVHEWEVTGDLPEKAFEKSDDEIVDADLAEVEAPDPPKAEVLMFSRAARRRKPEPEAETPAEDVQTEDEAKPVMPRSVRSKSKILEELEAEVENLAAEPVEEAQDDSDDADIVDEPLSLTGDDKVSSDEPEPEIEINGSLSEEEIRALVSKIIKEELKGPMGERITRNVRRLVRREISQALSENEND